MSLTRSERTYSTQGRWVGRWGTILAIITPSSVFCLSVFCKGAFSPRIHRVVPLVNARSLTGLRLRVVPTTIGVEPLTSLYIFQYNTIRESSGKLLYKIYGSHRLKSIRIGPCVGVFTRKVLRLVWHSERMSLWPPRRNYYFNFESDRLHRWQRRKSKEKYTYGVWVNIRSLCVTMRRDERRRVVT